MFEILEHRSIVFVIVPRAISYAFAFAFLLLGLQFSMGQEETAEVNSADSSIQSIAALQKIQKDFKDHLQKRERIFDQYKKIEEAFKENDEDFKRINNDAMRQQLLAIQASLQSRRMEDMLGDIQTNSQGAQGLRDSQRNSGVARAAISEKARADLDVAVRRAQLSQLDQAQQATVRRRIECLGSAISLQNEWLQWQQDSAKFLDRYWAHSDPERRFTLREIDARLKVLANADPNDYAAKITMALLLERVGQSSNALLAIESVLEANFSFKSTAFCTKALILSSLDQEKEMKAALHTAAKYASNSPYDGWIRARLAASRKQFSAAEREWRALISHKPFEFESRRALALVLFAKGGKNPLEKKRALKEAQLAFDLEPMHDWYSHLILGIAHHAAGNAEEAANELELAERKATEENIEFCSRIYSEITANQLSQWNFLNTCQ